MLETIIKNKSTTSIFKIQIFNYFSLHFSRNFLNFVRFIHKNQTNQRATVNKTTHQSLRT